jgi:2-oxoisovalerate dehydrogenase E2 component (dihydrolipoyl transacylase)
MKLFKLPDLGEGLPDAIIREWYVKEGDEISHDQPMVAMETAKALVDVPAPFDGKVEKLFGAVGDTIETGKPLIGFEGEGEAEINKDTGTVVGSIQEGGVDLERKSPATSHVARQDNTLKITPAVRALAKRLGVDLNRVQNTGARITAADIQGLSNNAPTEKMSDEKIPVKGEILSQARKAMVQSMTLSHSQVVPVSIVDDADLFSWNKDQDFTLRLLHAMVSGVQAVPLLNASFDAKNYAFIQNESINIGLAVDTPHGLFVPVLKDVANKSDAQLREKINQFKINAKDKTFSREDLQGATISLSNVGTIAGRYASPAVIPPMVAIVAFGKLRDEPVAFEGKLAIHPRLPVSLTFDHRLVTGGEAARFLKALIDSLEKNN